MVLLRAKLAWFNSPKRKIIAAVVGLLALAAVAALAALPFLATPSKSTRQTAQKPATKETSSPVPENTADTAKVVAPTGKQAEKPDASRNETSDKHDTEKPVPQPKTSALAPQKSDPPKPAGSAAVASQPPKSTAAADVKPAPAVVKPPAAPAIPDTKTGPATGGTPAPRPAEPAKKVSFDGLVADIELPPLGKNAEEPVSLGKIDWDPKTAIELKLLGGDAVAKGNPAFTLQKDGQAESTSWSIEMANKNKDAVKLARVWADQGELKMQWKAEPRDKASLLRYCALRLSAEKKAHVVALSKPKLVAPLPIDVDMGLARVPLIKGALLPEPSLLRLQILPLDKSLPKHQIKILPAARRPGRATRGKPVEPIAGDTVPLKGHALVAITKDGTPGVYFDIGFEARGKDLVLDMQAGCEIAGGEVPLNWSELRLLDARLNSFLMASDNDKNPNKKNMQTQIQAAKLARDRLKVLGEFATDLDKKATIPFRVYALLGEGEGDTAGKVVIFQSDDSKIPTATGPKKPLKGNRARGHAGAEVEGLELK